MLNSKALNLAVAAAASVSLLAGSATANTPAGHYRIISSMSSKCIDLDQGKNGRAPVVQQWDCNGLAHQNWKVEPVPDAGYRIRSAVTRECLEVAQNAILTQRKCDSQSENQSFNIQQLGANKYRLTMRITGNCLSLQSSSNANGAKLQQQSCGSDEPDQNWQLLPVERPNGIYRIVSSASSKCMDLDQGKRGRDSVIQQWDCNGLAHQNWKVEPTSGGGYRIRSAATSECMEVAENALLTQRKCSDQRAKQNFDIRRLGVDKHRITLRQTGNCLSLERRPNASGAKLQQRSCQLDGFGQNWKLLPVEPTDHLRPALHFAPAAGSMADPNALIYYDDTYHLFYQYSADGPGLRQGWGHATTNNFRDWHHLPLVLPASRQPNGNDVLTFSGTVVIDPNTSGKCRKENCLIAIYTSRVRSPSGEALSEYQSLAVSNDAGRTWQRHPTPVLDRNRNDFRDPKVFWYAPLERWVMSIARPKERIVEFYQSSNLISWKHTGSFESPGSDWHVWEVPNLVEVPVAGAPNRKRWVLIVSAGRPGAPKFGGVRYFVGQFDGSTFKADEPSHRPVVDAGKDLYAAIVTHLSSTEPALIGWMGNWAYAQNMPTYPWRGSLSTPRALSLSRVSGRWALTQAPIVPPPQSPRYFYKPDILPLPPYELHVTVKTSGARSGVDLTNALGQSVRIGYDPANRAIFVDRKSSGNVNFSPQFPSVDQAKLQRVTGEINLRIFVDKSSIEVFENSGAAVMTTLVFPQIPYSTAKPTSNQVQIRVRRM